MMLPFGLTFAQPWLLLFLLLPLVVLFVRLSRGGAAFPGFVLATTALRRSRGPLLFRVLAATGLALLVLAAARPQTIGATISEREQAGRDLILVIDLSGSMQTRDIVDRSGERSDRLKAVFAAAAGFVAKRPDDRLGLVFFGTRAVTACPPTYDHGTVLDFLSRFEELQRARWRAGDEDGLVGAATNLGLGLGLGLTTLGIRHDAAAATASTTATRETPLGRAIILITDGADSRDLPGWVDPLAAARHAQAGHVVVYGIGVGDPNGTMQVTSPFGQVFTQATPRRLLPDMQRLTAICTAARGEAHNAGDRAELEQVFARIDMLQPTPHLLRTRHDLSDHFAWLLACGACCLGFCLIAEPRLRGVA